MAIAAASVFEVRGGAGSDNNGGGFVAGASGTDYSQQNSAQGNGTNLTVDASTNTDVTPDGYTVGANDVGNLIQITAGAGFTTGFYQILSIQGGTKWRLDRSPAATSTAGGTWAIGGALNTIDKALAGAVAQNVIYVKAATYTITASLAVTQTALEIIGYNSSRTEWLDDETIGTRPLITTSTNSVHMWLLNTASKDYFALRNLRLSNTASTRGAVINVANSANIRQSQWVKVSFDGFLSWYNSIVNFDRAFFFRCEFKNFTSSTSTNACVAIPNNGGSDIWFGRCIFRDNAASAIFTNNNGVSIIAERCVFSRNGAAGIAHSAGGTGTSAARIRASGCIFNGNQDGIAMTTGSSNDNSLTAVNCVFYGQTRYGVNITTVPRMGRAIWLNYNAWGANSTADVLNCSKGLGSVTLTGDPFTNKASDDYTTNNTSGAGAAVRGVGSPASATYP